MPWFLALIRMQIIIFCKSFFLRPALIRSDGSIFETDRTLCASDTLPGRKTGIFQGRIWKLKNLTSATGWTYTIHTIEKTVAVPSGLKREPRANRGRTHRCNRGQRRHKCHWEILGRRRPRTNRESEDLLRPYRSLPEGTKGKLTGLGTDG